MSTNKINTQSKRDRLPPRREPYWVQLAKGRYIGYCKNHGSTTWRARVRDTKAKYLYEVLASGDALEYEQAVAAAVKWCTSVGDSGADHKTTVRDVIDKYLSNREKHASLAAATGARQRLEKWVPDSVMNTEARKLTTAQLTSWRDSMLEYNSDRRGDELFKERLAECASGEVLRQRKCSANKTLSYLKAALNLAYENGVLPDNKAWAGKKVKPFPDAESSRKLFLSVEQVGRMLEKADSGFRDLLKAAVLTGARYGELVNANVADFDPKGRTLHVDGKTGHRDIPLSAAAMSHFKYCTKNKLPSAPLLSRDDGERWGKSQQHRRLAVIVRAARLPADTVFYSLRHYHISQALIAGLPELMIAKATGTSLKMIESHYGKFRAAAMRDGMDRVQLL